MTITCTISNQPVAVLDDGSEYVEFTADGRGVATFNAKDLTGTMHFQPGQPVVITDTVGGFTFTGNINDSQETPLPPSTAIISQVNVVDGHYLADKRYYAGPEYQYRYAGDIATDLLRVLGPEGVSASYAVDNDQSVNDWQAGSLSGTSAQNNVPGGDLELSLAGSALEVVETGNTFSTGTVNNTEVVTTPAYPVGPITPQLALGQTPFNAIKMVAVQNLNNGGNTFSYVKFADGGGYTVPGGQIYFCYDVLVLASSPEIKIALDVAFTDGTVLRAATGVFDEQLILPHPNNDLSGLANLPGNWYHRGFFMGNYTGKTVAYYTVACEGDKVGTYTGYFQNINWANSFAGGSVLHNVYSGASTITAQQMQTYGYTTVVSVAACHNNFDFRWTPSHSLNGVGIVATTFISWSSIQTSGGFVAIAYSVDGGASFIFCQNNAPLPDFPNGVSVSGKSIQFKQFIGNAVTIFNETGSGTSVNATGTPEDTAYITEFEFTATPGYAGAKTDVFFDTSSPSQWSLGSFSNTSNNSGPTLSLSGAIRNWDDGNQSSQTLFGSANPEMLVSNRTQMLGTDSGTDVRAKMDFAGQYQNFTLEVDVQVPANAAIGMVYRTTNWGNSNDSYAYTCLLSTTVIILAVGNNSSGAGSASTFASTAITLTAGDWHRLKVVVNGSSHTAYLDNVQVVSGTDGTWSGAGYVGLRGYTNSGSHQRVFFDNFGVAPALTGTWISPAINLSTAVAYFNSDIYWADVSTDHTNCTVTTDFSTNNGSTWTTVNDTQALTNASTGSPLFTFGQSLSGITQAKIRFTLTTTTVTQTPAVNSLFFKLLGTFSASGNRVSEPLLLDGIGRVGSTLVAWSALQPASTGIFVDTSLDGINWTSNVAPGLPIAVGSTTYTGTGVIAGITTQIDPVIDPFDIDTSDDYTSTYRTGGDVGDWNWNTTLSRLEVDGGIDALLLYNSPTIGADVDVSVISDTSDNGGFCWRYQDRSNFYYLSIHDTSNGTAPNTVTLNLVFGNVKTQIGPSASITFTRGTPHTFRVQHIGSTITVSMDGVAIIAASDNTISAAGFAGLRNNTNGGSSANFYSFRLQFFGQIVDPLIVYSRVRLTSTDPTVTPQVMNLSVSAHDGNIQAGALIPLTSYSILNGNKTYLSGIFDDLAKQSGNYWWGIRNFKFFFQQHQATPAPWVLTGNDTIIGAAATQTLQITNINDHYRNQQWIGGGVDTIPQSQVFIGDGQRTSFDVAWKVDSITSITLNNAVQTVGIKGVDTGKDWYYTQGQTSIVADASEIPLNDLQSLTVDYNAQIDITVCLPNPVEIARLAAIDGTTGIVEEAEDSSGSTKAACIQMAYGLNSTYGQTSKTAQFSTLRTGLAVGQLLPIFGLMGIFDGAFLIINNKITWLSTNVNGVPIKQPLYSITAVSGPVALSWERFIDNLGN